MKDFGGPGFTNVEAWSMLYEMAKIDNSIATFMIAHNMLGLLVIDHLGSEEQRARLIPDCIKLKKVLAFGLTEPLNGSDASNL